MAISKDNDRLVVIISKSLKEEIQKLAQKENRSASNYVANLLEQHEKQIKQQNQI